MGAWAYCLGAFFVGAIPTAYLAGRLRGVDIRRHGSGNVGATNAFRVLGKGTGLTVFFLDALKGALPVSLFASSGFAQESAPVMTLGVGLAAILGHVFTPFLGFKGGKGVATGGGVLAAAYPVLFLVTLVTWVLVYGLTRIVSVGSLAAAMVLVIASFVLRYDPAVCLVFSGMALFTFWTHRSNIDRLLRGEEGKDVNRQK